MSNTFSNFYFNIFYIASRSNDAEMLAAELRRHGAITSSKEVPDDPKNESHHGKLYYFNPQKSELNVASKIALLAEGFEKLTPCLVNVGRQVGISFSIWIVKKPKSHKSLPSTAKSVPKNTCPVCQVMVRIDRLQEHKKRFHTAPANKLKSGSSSSQDYRPLREPDQALVYQSLSPKYGSVRFCVCEGSNDNCRYCYGTGCIAEGQLGEQGIGTASPKKSKTYKTIRTPLVHIPNRSIQTTSSKTRIPNRIETNSPNKMKKQKVEIVDASWVQCAKCFVHVQVDKINNHLERQHQMPPILNRKDKSTNVKNTPFNGIVGLESLKQKITENDQIKPASDFVICPQCRVRVKAIKLSRHLKKVHKPVMSASQSTNVGKRVYPSSSDLKANLFDNSYKAVQIERNLDSTKLYAHSYRESGKFGSHPSHDGFDDESNP